MKGTGLRARRLWGVLILAGFLAPPLRSAQIFGYEKSQPGKGHLIQNVPFVKWKERNYCGPACLAMVLNSWGDAGTFDQGAIGSEIFDAEAGATYVAELVLYPRSKGFESYSFRGDLRLLKELVADDIPVLVLMKTIEQKGLGHYRVVVGFDDDDGLIIFHDPFFGARQAMTVADFMKVWEVGKGRYQSRWAMIAVPGGHPLPSPAIRDDPMTDVELAAAYYRRSDLTKARVFLEKARVLAGRDPVPLYSLAMVSLKEGKTEEAVSYAQQALDIDSGNAYALDILGMAYAHQGLIDPALRSLGLAVRMAPKEEFIRNHYLRARNWYIDQARRLSSVDVRREPD